MDSQPSGNSLELLFIETDEFYFSIKGNDDSVKYGDLKSLTVLVEGKVYEVDSNKYLCFKEYTNYEIVIERKGKAAIEFYHENPNIRNKVTPTGRGGNILSGIINFKGDIGYSDLYIKINGKIHMKVTIEVLPSKIDYKEDYKAILQDVNEEIYNLAYGFLSRTYLGAEINNKIGNSYTEFYSILNYVYERLMKAIDIVIYNPHHELTKDARVYKYQSLKNISMDTIKWIEKRPHLLENINGKYIPTEALQVTKQVTLDTKENKYLKFMLIKIIEKIDMFIKTYSSSYWNKDSDIIDKLTIMKRGINKRLKTSFLNNVNSDYRNTSISMVFSMANGYKDIYKYYLMLQKGLSINSNIFSLSMKELSLLYEYWCFIKINSLLRKKYKLISSDFITVNREGIFVSLKKGTTSTLKYENPKTKETFKVCYNSIKSTRAIKSGSDNEGSRTVTQKPDNILVLDKQGSENAYEFIFDAKYKIDTSKEYQKKYGGIGPKEEDINTMHRYRDAIVYRNKKTETLNNSVFGAFVLFPYKDEQEYRNHDFYKSIEEVNIGGIPFLPSTTSLMEEFLDNLINESGYSNFERSLDSTGREEYIKEEYFKDRNVLVGALRNKEQLKVNLESKFYHTSCSNVNLAEHNVKFIALAQSKRQFGDEAGIIYYGKVSEIKIMQRNAIKELPSESEDDYYVFQIEEWKKLDKKIEVKGYQVLKVLYTTEFLLNNASVVTDLCIRSKEEYRLWQELKRVNFLTETQIGEKLSNDSSIKGFKSDEIKIEIDNSNIRVEVNNNVKEFTREEFNRKPREVMRRIMKMNC
ncbi:hypothetical protein CSC2_06400 [Clostridium zeae]|uniref:DUF2357 domain-containing protein n=1 Tax=Clostridium zeae TaxID=2759022 RepID=A0ABQ1E5V0_9CLOT|nr:restriction endonuclease-like protein [Clostridium zeae]GFZ30114.1 hypothetical protein CSC2_06400 [Clostridium zeae]